jgi:hypothetical protein
MIRALSLNPWIGQAIDLGSRCHRGTEPGRHRVGVPRNATAALSPTILLTLSVAGYGAAGRTSSGSASANAATVTVPAIVRRVRASPGPAQNTSSERCAASGVLAVIVRHHRPHR